MSDRPKSRGVLKNWYRGHGFNYGFVTLTETGQPDVAAVGAEVFIVGGDRQDDRILDLVDGKTIVEINGLKTEDGPTKKCPRGRSWRVFSQVAGCV